MPVDAKLGMSRASTKETFAISRLFSIGQKNCETQKNHMESPINPQEKRHYFSAKSGINRIK
jgi:hypothetical protein